MQVLWAILNFQSNLIQQKPKNDKLLDFMYSKKLIYMNQFTQFGYTFLQFGTITIS